MLPQLQAERQLLAIEAAAMPHMKAESQQRILANLQRIGEPDQTPVKATSSDLAAMGISVEYVDAEGNPVSDGTRADETGADL